MNKTLRWKKTIGALAIILGGLRFTTGLSTFSDIADLETTLDTYGSTLSTTFVEEVTKYISFVKIMLPIELIALGVIFTLGIVLLCTERNIDMNLPRPISRKIATDILIAAVIYFILEIIAFSAIPNSLSEDMSPTTIFTSLGFVSVLIIYCALGLKKQRNLPEHDFNTTAQPSTTMPATATQIDTQIEELKKEIEKRKLEKELKQLDQEENN